jgi:Zn-dependent oligopeptidase
MYLKFHSSLSLKFVFFIYYRNDIAELLGYSNYAELAVQQNMAGSLENVVNLLDA